MLLLEFTIEPFVEGEPGPHVISAIEAARSLGFEIDFGPFGSSCRVPAGRAGEVAKVVVDAAFANGATHVIPLPEIWEQYRRWAMYGIQAWAANMDSWGQNGLPMNERFFTAGEDLGTWKLLLK